MRTLHLKLKLILYCYSDCHITFIIMQSPQKSLQVVPSLCFTHTHTIRFTSSISPSEISSHLTTSTFHTLLSLFCRNVPTKIMAQIVNSSHLIAAKMVYGTAQTVVVLDTVDGCLPNQTHILDIAIACHQSCQLLSEVFLLSLVMSIQ